MCLSRNENPPPFGATTNVIVGLTLEASWPYNPQALQAEYTDRHAERQHCQCEPILGLIRRNLTGKLIHPSIQYGP